MITLIMLVVMTLSVIALIRSTDTTNLIAGNVAFQQGASNAAEQGIEAGASFLYGYVGNPSGLYANSPANGYYSTIITPQASASNWWAWWTTNSANSVTLTTDPLTGNTVSYLIERLCSTATNPWDGTNVCQAPPPVMTPTSLGQGAALIPVFGPVYYRITSHVQGAKNTQSLVQVIVSQ